MSTHGTIESNLPAIGSCQVTVPLAQGQMEAECSGKSHGVNQFIGGYLEGREIRKWKRTSIFLHYPKKMIRSTASCIEDRQQAQRERCSAIRQTSCFPLTIDNNRREFDVIAMNHSTHSATSKSHINLIRDEHRISLTRKSSWNVHFKCHRDRSCCIPECKAWIRFVFRTLLFCCHDVQQAPVI